MGDKRRFPRVASRSRCWCETEGITLYARLVNVSEGGVFIRTFAPLSRGMTARLRFLVDGGGPEVSFEAEVVWVREKPAEPNDTPGMGLRFLAGDEKNVEAIRQFVARAGPEALVG